MAPRYVIVGASLAGATAAITLREEGADGTVTLIGAEKELPYERPPLSKAYLRGDVPFDKALVRPAAFYAEHGIETMFGTRATRIDPSDRFVELEDHRRVPFDALLIATGGRNRRVSIPGGDLDGIYGLRTVQDADRIRARDGCRSPSRRRGYGVHRLGSGGVASAERPGRCRHRPVENAALPRARRGGRPDASPTSIALTVFARSSRTPSPPSREPDA